MGAVWSRRDTDEQKKEEKKWRIFKRLLMRLGWRLICREQIQKITNQFDHAIKYFKKRNNKKNYNQIIVAEKCIFSFLKWNCANTNLLSINENIIFLFLLVAIECTWSKEKNGGKICNFHIFSSSVLDLAFH